MRSGSRHNYRKSGIRKKTAGIIAVLVIAAVVAAFAACDAGGEEEGKGSGFSQKSEEAVDISILCVGDVMAHSTNITAALSAGGGSAYSFTDNYQYVKSYIEEADLALCNVETTFGGGQPHGYPTFNAPDELAYALADTGFDVGITSNNHMMDTGFDGMQRTLEVLRNQGMATVGSRFDGEDTWTIAEANGLKIGLVAYTYESPSTSSGAVSINGNYVSKEAEELINSFNVDELDTDLEKICGDIDSARKAGADIVVCYLHWGSEYQREPDENQTYMAQTLADRGADIIFASHPHVLQKTDILTSEDGRNVPVFYSMGNFISNQRTETLPSIANKRYTEQGMIAVVDLSVMKSTGEIIEKTMRVIPTWVDRYGSPTKYAIVPLDADMNSNAALNASGHLSRAQEALEDVTALLGEDCLKGINMPGISADAEKSEKKAA